MRVRILWDAGHRKRKGKPDMCGIVGLFLKDEQLKSELGRLTAMMLIEMSDRGPDSTGFAVYGEECAGVTKICAVAARGSADWSKIASLLSTAIGAAVTFQQVDDHAIFRTTGNGEAARKWLIDNVADATVLSQGRSIEIYKGVGNPGDIAARLDLQRRKG